MLLQVDPSVPSTTMGQVVIAITLLILIFAFVVIVGLRTRYVGLEETNAQVVATVQRQLARMRSGTVRISQSDAIDSRRGDISESFAATGSVEDTTSVPEAAGEVRHHFHEFIRPYVETIPAPARRFLAMSVSIFVFGSVALGAEAIRRGITAEARPLAPLEWPAIAIDVTLEAYTVFMAVVGDLPVLGTIGALAFSFAILIWEWAYHRWWLFSLLLAAVAIRIILLDREGAESTEFDVPTPMTAVKAIAAAVSLGWVAVLVPSGVARLVDREMTGEVGGAALGIVLVASAAILSVLVIRWMRDLRTSYRVAADDNDRGRLLVRLFGLGLAVIVAPLLPVWAVVAASNVPMLASAFLEATLTVQLLAAFSVIAGVASATFVVRDAAEEVRSALRETVSRRGWQAAIFGRAVPSGVVGVAYLLALGIGQSWLVALAIAVAAGVVAAGLWKLSLRMRERVEAMPDGTHSASTVVIHAYEVKTPRGTQFIARVNGDLVAHPTREGAVDAVCERAGEAFADRRPRPTVGQVHARMLIEDGVTDLEETDSRLRSEARRLIEGTVLHRGSVDYRDLERELVQEVPEEIATAQLERAPKSPHTPVRYQGGMLLAT